MLAPEESAVSGSARRRTAAGFAYVLSATVVWSIVPVGIKYLLSRDFDPCFIAFSRFALASGALLLVAGAARPTRSLGRQDLPLLLMGGAGMAGNYILYALGLRYTTASATNIIVQDEVIALVILSHFVLGERIGRVKLLGMLAALLGIGVVFWNGQSMRELVSSRHLLGNAIIFLAGLSWPFYALAQKFLSRRRAPNVRSLACIFGIAAALSVVPAALRFRAPDGLPPAVFVWFFIVGVISTGLGYVLLARAFDRLTASTVGIITCMMPIFTLLMARIFLREYLTVNIALGALFVVSGIALIGRDEAGQETPVAE